jgi:hypothetical protein
VALYSGGLLFYFWIAGAGRADFDTLDWPVFRQYLDILRTAVRSGVVPFHAYLFPEDLGVMQTEYFARVHLIIAPHVLLLVRFLSVDATLLIHVLANYSIGYLGLARLCRENRLDRLSFWMLFTIFVLGGFIVSKLVAGQVNDLAYFFLPHVLLYCQRILLAETDAGAAPAARDAVVRLSLLLVYGILQAGLHVIHIFFLILLCLLLPRWPSALRFASITALVLWGGAIRLLTTLVFTRGYMDPVARVSWTGYGTWVLRGGPDACSVRSPTCWLSELTRALAVVTPIDYPDNGFWELDAFVGVAALALVTAGLAFFSIQPNSAETVFVAGSAAARRRLHRRVGASAALIGLLSLGPLYAKIFNPLHRLLHVPHVNNMPTHMIIYPLFVATFYAAGAWQAARSANAGHRKLLTRVQIALTALTVLACVEHAAIWNVGYVERHAATLDADVTGYRDSKTMTAGILDAPVSPCYRAVLYGSGALTATYLLAVAGYAARRRMRPAEAGASAVPVGSE